jgi:hypothetical protein
MLFIGHKRKKLEKEIVAIELEMNGLYFQEMVGYLNEYKLRVNHLEKRKRNILTNKEVAWRLKSRTL